MLYYFAWIPSFLMHRGAYIGFILGGLVMVFGSIIFVVASPLQRGCRDLKGPEYTFLEMASNINIYISENHLLTYRRWGNFCVKNISLCRCTVLMKIFRGQNFQIYGTSATCHIQHFQVAIQIWLAIQVHACSLPMYLYMCNRGQFTKAFLKWSPSETFFYWNCI